MWDRNLLIKHLRLSGEIWDIPGSLEMFQDGLSETYPMTLDVSGRLIELGLNGFHKTF